MRIEEHLNDDGVVWVLSGRLTRDDADVFVRAVSRAAHCGWRRIVLDLSGVSMIDAGGLGCLAAVYRASAANRIGVGLARAPNRIRQLLTLTHLTQFLPIFDSVEQARSRWPQESPFWQNDMAESESTP
jgi:anti-anti-sigma factor